MSDEAPKPADNAPAAPAATAPAVSTAEAKPAVESAAKASDDAKPPVNTEAKPASESKPSDSKTNDKPAGVPEKYDLKVPENSLLSAAHVEAISNFAKEKGFTNEQAQVLLERENSAAQAGVESMNQKAKQLGAQWLNEAKADKEIGGEKFAENVMTANSALDALFPGVEIRKFMDQTGLGNNPVVLKGFVKIGNMLKNDTIHRPTTQPVPKTSIAKQDDTIKKMYDHPTSPK